MRCGSGFRRTWPAEGGLARTSYVLASIAKRRTTNRAVVQERIEPARHLVEQAAAADRRHSGRRAPPSDPAGPSAGTAAVTSGATSRRSSSAREPRAQPPLAQLREHQRHIVVFARLRARDAKRAIERLLHETRRLRCRPPARTRDRRRLRAETREAATGRTRRSSRWRCRRVAREGRAIGARRAATNGWLPSAARRCAGAFRRRPFG